jgi:GT2 family glycosyltransferase/2-polyprenyl-3-methyl-5-hydroxy-6-metoxy-1,4-benzoquinol methylase
MNNKLADFAYICDLKTERLEKVVNTFLDIFSDVADVSLLLIIPNSEITEFSQKIDNILKRIQQSYYMSKIHIQGYDDTQEINSIVNKVLFVISDSISEEELRFKLKEMYLLKKNIIFIDHKNFTNLDLYDVEWERYRRFKRIADLIRKDFPNKEKLIILDAGGDDGLLSAFLPEHYIFLIDERTTGGKIESLDLSPNFFDIVTCLDVIEHIPISFRKECIERLATLASRKLYITFPHNVNAQEFVYRFTKNRWLEEHLIHGIPTEEEIERYLYDLGLNNFRKDYYCYTGTWISMMANIHNLPYEKFKELNRKINELEDFDHHPPYLRIVFSIDTDNYSKHQDRTYQPKINELEFTGERMVPGKADQATELQHINRYIYVKDLIKDMIVLDVACGEGYGSNILAETARRVIGIDISDEAINQASKKYIRENLSFKVMNAEELSFDDNYFDAVVSFETIEHLEKPYKFLKEVKRVLKPSGLFIVSTPNRDLASLGSPIPLNKFHKEEWTFEQFIKLIRYYFPESEFIGQYGYYPWEIHKNATPKDLFYIAIAKKEIASDDKVPSPSLTSIVILTLNNLEYTKQCIESIRRYTPEAYEIIVVDNGSKDGTIEYLESQPDIKLIKNPTNLGFALGNNIGMKEARGDYIVVLNNDTIVTQGWLTRLIACAESDPSIGIVGPRSNYVAGIQIVKDVPYDNDMNAMQEFARKWSIENSGKYEETIRVIGFCMLIKREVIEKIGGFDPLYESGNFEDDDFCIRAIRAGFKIKIAHDVFIHHYGSKTFASEKINYTESMLKNWERFKRKWGIPSGWTIDKGIPILELIKGGFDRDKHYVPLDITPLRVEGMRSRNFLGKLNPGVIKWFLSNYKVEDDVALVLYEEDPDSTYEKLLKIIDKLGYKPESVPDIIIYSDKLSRFEEPKLIAGMDGIINTSQIDKEWLEWARRLGKGIIEI